MSGEISGFPPELASVDVADGAARIEVDESLYPLEALYGASYIFIDRCFVLLDRPRAGHFRVTLAAKNASVDAQTLRTLVGEFTNELLSCAWRHQITRDNRALIEQVTTKAIGGALGPPSLDELAKYDFTGEALEDPLGIALSWEEKYKQKKEEAK